MQPFVVSVPVCFEIGTAFNVHFSCTVGSHAGQYLLFHVKRINSYCIFESSEKGDEKVEIIQKKIRWTDAACTLQRPGIYAHN